MFTNFGLHIVNLSSREVEGVLVVRLYRTYRLRNMVVGEVVSLLSIRSAHCRNIIILKDTQESCSDHLIPCYFL